MKVIKKINNNFAIALDSNNEELIIYGKGVGFPSMPYELTDLSKIDQTYYNTNEQSASLLNEIPEDIIKVAQEIVDICSDELDTRLNPNMTFTLADHIAFAIKRYNEKIDLHQPVLYDMISMYPKESEIAQKAVKIINYRLDTDIPKSESGGILLNIINNELTPSKISQAFNSSQVIEHIVSIVEMEQNIRVETSSTAYMRFATHVNYLIQRLTDNQKLETNNLEMVDALIEKYPKQYQTALKIKGYLERVYAVPCVLQINPRL